jgi:DNA-binding response OmpR family regulator
MNVSVRIVWCDDEIEMLKPQIQFLTEKGYSISPISNGFDALELIKNESFDILFLDESMPGMSGLETLAKVKELRPYLPVVLITKNEEENLMDDAIGSQITDYLIKPVRPTQLILAIKKIIDNKRLVEEKTNTNYQQEFQRIFMAMSNNETHEDWVDTYKKLIFWELELERAGSDEMHDILTMQKREANTEFYKFFTKNYIKWMSKPDENTPVMSHTLFKNKIFPHLKESIPTIVVLIDNLRFDQWRMIQPMVQELFTIHDEETFFSILPACTQYSRNSIFAGLTPLEIERKFPDKWKNDEDEGGKNMFEKDFLLEQLKNYKGKQLKADYVKITNHEDALDLENKVLNMLNFDLGVIVYNFVDMLSHARTEMEVLKELASDEAAYRSLTVSWFDHSPLHNALKKLATKKVNIIITTDHGTVRVTDAVKVVGDRTTTTNLRYKHGRNLAYDKKDVFEVKNPHEAGLPKPNVSSAYIFARQNDFFAYPNNYNHYVNYYKNTFQHGGISLEEIIIPVVYMSSKI